MCVFTGIVMGLYQRYSDPEVYGGLITKQIGAMLWFSVTTFFSTQIAMLNGLIPRVVAGVWQFVVLIVTAFFTASLTSRMTVSQLEPAVVDIDFLKTANAAVGCNGNSFIVSYLIDVLGFKPESTKKIASIDDYPLALSSGDIKAAFFVELQANALQGYTKAGQKYTLGGFGFAFKKGSPLAFDISEAILKLIEKGKLEHLQRNFLYPSNCSTSRTDVTGTHSLLSGIFTITGVVSAAALFRNFLYPSNCSTSRTDVTGTHNLLSGIFTITGVVSAAALFIIVDRRLQLHLQLQIYTRAIYSRTSQWVMSLSTSM
ncbi:glutamate receptor 3.2-like [Telopea speciosissima]|uniref:glutamate receptor 3.2-like n=1 Tax=Telopea speciosissima TaxID=54955 RepID=UPI001CC768AD|nr:glutamate receptor 3.2-like [Telopea speciosissima]